MRAGTDIESNRGNLQMTTRAVGPGKGWEWLLRAANLGRNNPKAIFGAVAWVALLALVPSILQLALQYGLHLGPTAVMSVIGLTTLFSIVLYPLLIVVITLFALGVGLALSVYNVYYRDVNYLVGIGMNLLFYATPIIYPITAVPEEAAGLPLRSIFELNPIAQFVGWSRDIFWAGTWPSAASFLGVIAVSVLTFVVGLAIFNRKSRDIAQEL